MSLTKCDSLSHILPSCPPPRVPSYATHYDNTFANGCRDSDDMRAAGRMTHFPPSEETFVGTVGFNRCQYAMLCQQRFAPSRGMSIPSASQQPKEFRAAEVGLKLTAGFEILWARAARVGRLPCQIDQSLDQERLSDPSSYSGSQAMLTEKQLSELPSWFAYKTSLERTGYYEGNIPGSERQVNSLKKI